MILDYLLYKPISCGSSWHSTAKLVETPLAMPEEAKATPIVRPSTRLCTPSPSITIQAELEIARGADGRWENLWLLSHVAIAILFTVS